MGWLSPTNLNEGVSIHVADPKLGLRHSIISSYCFVVSVDFVELYTSIVCLESGLKEGGLR